MSSAPEGLGAGDMIARTELVADTHIQMGHVIILALSKHDWTVHVRSFDWELYFSYDYKSILPFEANMVLVGQMIHAQLSTLLRSEILDLASKDELQVH